jgi:CTP synthase
LDAPSSRQSHRRRHRHCYEFNREHEAVLTGGSLGITGTTPDSTYVEIPPTTSSSAASSTRIQVQTLEHHPIFRDFIAASYQNHLRLTADLITEDARTSNQ